VKEEVFLSTQDLAAPRREVFAFFADPANLEALTPPWLRFEVLTPRPLPCGEGALFEYRIKVRGLPIRWRTLIALWVRRDIQRIFEYRQRVLAERFTPAPAPRTAP